MDIYAYPKEPISPIRNLLRFHGAFKGETADGLLAFDYSPSNDKWIRPGASGGLVVDSKTQQIVGIFSGIARDAERIAVAVPVQSLFDFVSKVQPWLAQRLFPTASKEAVSPASADLYPRFVPPPPSGVLQHRPDEPPEVVKLRRKAQDLADSIRNFIAVQGYEWGSGSKAPAARAEYEVRVVDGDQIFRKLPDGKKELREVPNPALMGSVVPGDEWSKLPKMVGMDPRLRVNYAGDAVAGDRRLKVFQYYASLEDESCSMAPGEDYLFFVVRHTVTVPCYGEVWTDADTNVVRISENLDLSEKLRSYRGWEKIRVIITYGWLRRVDEPARLAPLTILTEAGYGKHMYWCRGLFTDYRIFDSRARIVNASGDGVQNLQP